MNDVLKTGSFLNDGEFMGNEKSGDDYTSLYGNGRLLDIDFGPRLMGVCNISMGDETVGCGREDDDGEDQIGRFEAHMKERISGLRTKSDLHGPILLALARVTDSGEELSATAIYLAIQKVVMVDCSSFRHLGQCS